MSLNKNRTIQALATRLNLSHFEAQRCLEALLTLWHDELVQGGSLTYHDLFTIQVRTIQQQGRGSSIHPKGQLPTTYHRLEIRPGQQLKAAFKKHLT